jgi:hypothetical protein
MRSRSPSAKAPTPIFCTTARKVEPIGSDCVRIYLAVESGGAWEDRVVIEMPIRAVLENSQFVVDATTEIACETRAVAPVEREKLLAH